MEPDEMFDKLYFARFIPRDGGFMDELEMVSLQKDIPIIGPSVGKLLYVVTRLSGARKVLELGTANGYSTIWLARAVGEGGKVTTLEYDADMTRTARRNLSKAGVSGLVEIVESEAMEYMASLTDEFDLIFMDIEKETYTEALPHCVRLLKKGGVLFADNVAFRSSGDFNDHLFAHPDLETVFVYGNFVNHSPDEDAVSISVKI